MPSILFFAIRVHLEVFCSTCRKKRQESKKKKKKKKRHEPCFPKFFFYILSWWSLLSCHWFRICWFIIFSVICVKFIFCIKLFVNNLNICDWLNDVACSPGLPTSIPGVPTQQGLIPFSFGDDRLSSEATHQRLTCYYPEGSRIPKERYYNTMQCDWRSKKRREKCSSRLFPKGITGLHQSTEKKNGSFRLKHRWIPKSHFTIYEKRKLNSRSPSDSKWTLLIRGHVLYGTCTVKLWRNIWLVLHIVKLWNSVLARKIKEAGICLVNDGVMVQRWHSRRYWAVQHVSRNNVTQRHRKPGPRGTPVAENEVLFPAGREFLVLGVPLRILVPKEAFHSLRRAFALSFVLFLFCQLYHIPERVSCFFTFFSLINVAACAKYFASIE